MVLMSALVLLALSGWSLVSLSRRLIHLRVSRSWWAAFGFMVFCGLGLGIWCSFWCEYRVGTSFRIGGFPLPVVFFHLEEGTWVDFPLPEFQAWLVMIANVITITTLLTLPTWFASSRQLRKFIASSD